MIQSVVRAFGILETINGGSEDEMGLVEIAKHLGLEKSTIHNLIKTLKDLGYVEQDGDGRRYRLGAKLIELSHGSIHGDEYLRELLTPLSRELQISSGENISVVAYRRGRVSIICRELCDNEVVTVPNRFKPFYTTITGRCLLAQLSEDKLEAVLSVYGLPGELWDGVSDHAALLTKLDKIRTANREVMLSESREVGGVGYIISANKRFCPLAIGTALPLYRFREKQEMLLKQVGETARKMSLLLQQTAKNTTT